MVFAVTFLNCISNDWNANIVIEFIILYITWCFITGSILDWLFNNGNIWFSGNAQSHKFFLLRQLGFYFSSSYVFFPVFVHYSKTFRWRCRWCEEVAECSCLNKITIPLAKIQVIVSSIIFTIGKALYLTHYLVVLQYWKNIWNFTINSGLELADK